MTPGWMPGVGAPFAPPSACHWGTSLFTSTVSNGMGCIKVVERSSFKRVRAAVKDGVI